MAFLPASRFQSNIGRPGLAHYRMSNLILIVVTAFGTLSRINVFRDRQITNIYYGSIQLQLRKAVPFIVLMKPHHGLRYVHRVVSRHGHRHMEEKLRFTLFIPLHDQSG